MADRLNELREARDLLTNLLLDYEKENGGNALRRLGDPANDITEERKTTIRRTIKVLERQITDLERDDA